MLQHTHGEAAKDVDEQNQNASDRISANKLGRSIHGAKKVGLFGNFRAAAFRFFFVNRAGIQVGVHRHLFAGHGIQCKSC